MKKLVSAQKAAQMNMMKSMADKDAEIKKKAQDDYVKAEDALDKASENVPELVAMKKKETEADAAVLAKKKELILTIPEGEAIVAEMDRLEKKLAVYQKQYDQQK